MWLNMLVHHQFIWLGEFSDIFLVFVIFFLLFLIFVILLL